MSLKYQLILQLLIIVEIGKCLTIERNKTIVDILIHAEDLSPEERSALRPFYEELQAIYDEIDERETVSSNKVHYNDSQLEYACLSFERELAQALFPYQTNDSRMDFSLEALTRFDAATIFNHTSAETLKEAHDLRIILEESLGEISTQLLEIEMQSRQIESSLIHLQKPKVLTYLYKALVKFYHLVVRIPRAAYCTYSQIPELNRSWHQLQDSITCYKYTSKLLKQTENQAKTTVQSVEETFEDLSKLYEKVAKMESLAGKIFYLWLFAPDALPSIKRTYTVLTKSLNDLKMQLPPATTKAFDCGQEFAQSLPQISGTITDLRACVLFVDEERENYEFMKPLQIEEFQNTTIA